MMKHFSSSSSSSHNHHNNNSSSQQHHTTSSSAAAAAAVGISVIDSPPSTSSSRCCCLTINSNRNRDSSLRTSNSNGGGSSCCGHLSSSKTFLLQAVFIWILLCWPGNIVTLILFNSSPSAAELDGTNSTEETDYPIADDEGELAVEEEEPEIRCYESREDYLYFVESVSFWVEGVGVSAVGAFGVFGNALTIAVLRRIRANRNFNKLLLALGAADLALILTIVVDMSIIRGFMGYEPSWFRVLYPHVLHPLRGLVQTCAVYMVVAVSAERFRAICHPLAHRQPHYKFVFVALLCSATLEIPRFFEFKLAVGSDNRTDYVTTALMENPDYIRFNSYWNELFATGALPLFALTYMNFRIYRKIRSSSRFSRRFVSTNHHHSSNSRHNTLRATAVTSTANGAANRGGSESGFHQQRQSSNAGSVKRGSTAAAAAAAAVGANSPDGNETEHMLKAELCRSGSKGRNQTLTINNGSALNRQNTVGSNEAANAASSPLLLRRHQNHEETEPKRRHEKSTIILVSIVVIFLVCHTYRLCLKLYELTHPENQTFRTFVSCRSQGLYHIPVAFIMLTSVHHLLLVANSSVNFIIYCCVGREFRANVVRWFCAAVRGGKADMVGATIKNINNSHRTAAPGDCNSN